MAASLSNVPSSLKQVQHYLKTAVEHDKRDPTVAYYCRLYAFQKALEIDRSSPEAKQFLGNLIGWLEGEKKSKQDESIHSEVVGQAHMEDYALKLFSYADTEDRAGRFGKHVVKSFYTAGMLFDVLTTFGEISEDIADKQKYAKWKAAYIHKCLKDGETPHAGPLGEEGDEEGAVGGGEAPGTLGFEGMNHPPTSTSFNSLGPGTYAPPTTPQDPPAAAARPAPTPQAPPPHQQPAQVPQWTPPANATGVQLNTGQYQKAMKYCKFAGSALQYEDASTAIDNLTKALKLLTLGHE